MPNQHYVPQFLLRGFARGKAEQIHVYDKVKERTFVTSIRNVAAETGFYDYECDGKGQSFDPFFTRMEADVGPIIGEIRENESLSFLSEDNRLVLALFTAVQLMRTRYMRECLQDLDDKLYAWLLQHTEDPNQVEGYSRLSKEQVKLASIRNVKAAEELAPYLLRKSWILYKSRADQLLQTSDNPVTLHNLMPRPGRGSLGVGVPGIVVYLPVSCRLTLCFLCERVAAAFQEGARKAVELKWRLGGLPRTFPCLLDTASAIRSGRPIELTFDGVMHHNSLQVSNAARFVIAADSDFTLAKRMIQENPELKAPPQVLLS